MPTLQDALLQAGLNAKPQARRLLLPVRKLHRGYSMRSEMCRLTEISYQGFNMATFTTTLAAAVKVSDNQIIVADPTGITNPGAEQAYNESATYIKIDLEWMEVSISYQAGSIYVPVIRGTEGTAVVPHAAGATVLIQHRTPNQGE
jgi:hypothetical protein